LIRWLVSTENLSAQSLTALLYAGCVALAFTL
jgi:hypothetical protein